MGNVNVLIRSVKIRNGEGGGMFSPLALSLSVLHVYLFAYYIIHLLLEPLCYIYSV